MGFALCILQACNDKVIIYIYSIVAPIKVILMNSEYVDSSKNCSTNIASGIFSSELSRSSRRNKVVQTRRTGVGEAT